MKIQGSVALVTGANRGLGLAFAQALLAAGARKVYAGARNPQSVTLPGVIPVELDVTKPEQIEAAALSLGDVNLLINNAGIYRDSSLSGDDPTAVTRETFETNFYGVLAVTKAFGPILAANGGGAVANMLSVLSWVALPGSLAYSASKAAALLLTDATRLELAAQGTQVLAIHAGYIDTNLVADVDAPKTRPAVVARKTLEALEAGRQEILIDEISGQVKSQLSAPKPTVAA